MDINLLRIAVTLASLAAFICIALWAYRPSRKELQEMRGGSILEDREP